MTKSNKKALAAIALAACMTTCASVALTRLANTAYAETAHTASVQTAKSVRKTKASEKVIAESLQITAGTSASVNVGNIVAGQYFAYVTIQESIGENYDPYDLFVTIGGETSILTYNYMIGKYEAVVKVTPNATLEVSTNSKNTLVVDVAFGNLYIGMDNEYTISGVEIPAESSLTVEVEGAEASEYILTVDIGEAELVNGAKLYAKTNATENLYKLEHDSDDGKYTATIQLTAATTSLTIESTNPDALTASINLFKVIHYDALPSSTTLTMWEAVTYTYTVNASGYYSIDVWSTTDETVEVGVTLKTVADAWEGLSVLSKEYPLYMEAGTTYYFDLVLTNAASEKATVNTNVRAWGNPDLELNEVTYLPVVSEMVPSTSPEYVESTLNAVAGKYNLTLLEVPFMYYMTGVTVTATVDGVKYELTAENGYSAVVTTTTDYAKVSFTTADPVSTVLGVSFAIPEVRNYIELGKMEDIKAPAEATVAYYIENMEVGTYYIVLDGVPADADLTVYSSVSEGIVIPNGETMGGFQVRWEGGDFAILFTNNGAEDLSFKAGVYKAEGEYTIGLAEMQHLTIGAKTRTTYYMYGLAAGNYAITVTDNVSVWVDGVAVDIEAGKGTFMLNSMQDDGGIITVSIKNNNATAATIDVTVMPLDLMELGVAVNLKAYAWYFGTTAYYIHLMPGTYSAALYLPEELGGSITVNNEYVDNNVFTVEKESYVAIRISVYSFTDNELDYKALVNTVGAMEFDTDKDIKLSADNFSMTYEITLKAGTYDIGLFEVVGAGEIQVNVGYEIVIAYGSFSGTITVPEDATVYVTFTYNGTASISFVAAIY